MNAQEKSERAAFAALYHDKAREITILSGEDDFLLNLPDWAALREQNPAAHLLHIPFAGHEAIKAQPDILWAAIQTFHKP